MLYVQLLALGVGVGVVSGLLGIGGGILLVPGLMLLFQYTQQQAQGTSLAAMIPPIGIFAAMVYYQHGYVKIPVAAAVAAGFTLGALAGAKLLPLVPTRWLSLAFGGLLLYVGFKFIFEPASARFAAALPAGLAAALTAAGAWLRGRRVDVVARLPPPDGHTEYHI